MQRGKDADFTEKMNLDLMLKKLEHYSTRYGEHYRAIGFAKKKKEEILQQIKLCLEISKKYGPQDFVFLEEIAELVISMICQCLIS